MSDFINYRNRGIKLPPASKDIDDILSSSKEACIPTEGLEHVERYVSRLLQKSDGRRSVWIHSYTFPVMLGLIPRKGKLGTLIFLTAEREQSMRTLLSKSGITPTQDDAIGDNEYFSRFLLCSLPADASIAGQFVLELLRTGYGLPEDAKLEFHYKEKPPRSI